MSLKSIRDSYSKLLNAFDNAGIKLTENQKNAVDGFVLAIESTMSKQREMAIRKTKKAVTEKLEKQFKGIFESIMTNIAENTTLASKIQDINTKMNESKKIAEKVDKYLDLYVESVLPKKTIVDYDRMQKLEKIHESLKDSLLASEEEVEAKKTKLEEAFKSRKSKCETEVAKMTVKLNEANSKLAKMQKKLDALKAVELLESKTKNLPDFEARSMKKRLAEASEKEIQEKFDDELKEVRDNAAKLAEEEDKDMQTTLESEIDSIINDDELEEDDLLKSKPHNGNAQHNGHIAECDSAESMKKETVEEDDEEEFETTEVIKEDEFGDIQLEESEIIPAGLMKLWCNQAIEVR